MIGWVLIGSVCAAPTGRYARQLAEECDGLIDAAVKRPYGWAWAERLDRDPKDRRPTVTMQPGGTPAAGLVLLCAGILLEEPRYIDAATNVARAMVTSQTGNGNILSNPTFAASPGGREPPAAVPDRGPTRAGLALLLAVIGADPVKDEMFRRSAIRAASWLIKQQSDDGGWPSSPPQEDLEDVPSRLIRLDTSDYRDSTVALLLATNVIDDRLAAKAAKRSIDKLISLQLSGPGKLGGLWATFYRRDGSLLEKVGDWPAGVDALASRRSVETLLAAGLLEKNEDALIAMRESVRALANLRGEDGLWPRVTPLRGTLAPRPPSLFQPASTQPTADPAIRADFGIESLILTTDLLQKLGPEQFATQLSQSATIQERLAMVICGVSDAPFASDWPQTAAQVESFLKRHELRWQSLEGSVPAGLSERVARLYALLLRARLEAQFGQERNP